MKIWDLEIQTTLKLFREFMGSLILDAIVTTDNILILLAQKNHSYMVCLFDLNNLYKYGNEKKVIKERMEEVEVLFRIQEKHLNYVTLSPDGELWLEQDQFGSKAH